jgi:DNA primase
MSTIDEIKSKIDIVDLVSEAGVKLRHSGRNHTGFCPFHDNKRTPAFVVWPETGTWRCFGQCNEGGDIFKFVMKKDGLDFKEALQKLAERAGVKIESLQHETPQQKEAFEQLRALLEEALVYYRGRLFENKAVLAYLREKRGLKDSTIEAFGLGYAPQGWDTALKHFSARGFSQRDLIDAGLLTERPVENGSGRLAEQQVYDRFRHRIMIPIRDEQGRMAGFGARVVDAEDIPKFLNSPETPIFSKGRLLYGLDRARKPIRAADQAVIVEGYLDVIALHQAGFENVVSPMGTALTEDQLRLLKRFTRRIVLALDPDTAGQKAVLRGLEAARNAMDREGELDPDELVARDPGEWKQLVEGAKPVVEHVLDMLLAGRDANDPKVKNQVAQQVLPLIADLPNAVERDTYRQMLARRLRVDERAFSMLPAQHAAARRKTRSTPAGKIEEDARLLMTRPGQKIEMQVLSVLFRKPELLYQLDRLLQQASLNALQVEDFEYTDHQILFRLIRQSLEQVEAEHHAFVAARVPETLQGLAKDLLAQSAKLDPVEDRLLEELFRNIVKIRRLVVEENINQLRFIMEEARQEGDLRATGYQQLAVQHSRLRNSLDRALIKSGTHR